MYAVSWGDSFLLVLLLILPVLFLCLVAACAVFIVRRKGRREAVAILALSFAVPIVLLPILFLYGGVARNSARFALWSLTHLAEFRSATRHAAVLSHWDAWGFAGNDNDVYLVSDPTDGLAGALMPRHVPVLPGPKFAVAQRWGRSLDLGCDLVWVSRVWRGFYLVTTYECWLSPPAKS